MNDETKRVFIEQARKMQAHLEYQANEIGATNAEEAEIIEKMRNVYKGTVEMMERGSPSEEATKTAEALGEVKEAADRYLAITSTTGIDPTTAAKMLLGAIGASIHDA